MSKKILQKYDPSSLELTKDLSSDISAFCQLFWDKTSKKYVVVKAFLSSGNEEILENFLENVHREAKILATIKHDNILRVFGTIV